jgi:hypothetical protein
MRKMLLVIALFCFVSIACNHTEKKFDQHTYEEQKISLLDKEKANPPYFLKLEGSDKRNIWGQTVYKGVIKNTATVCSYKEIRVKLLYFKEGQQVANHEEFFSDVINAQDEYSFKAKYKTPKHTDSVYAYIMSAKAAK